MRTTKAPSPQGLRAVTMAGSPAMKPISASQRPQSGAPAGAVTVATRQGCPIAIALSTGAAATDAPVVGRAGAAAAAGATRDGLNKCRSAVNIVVSKY
jgi:hypothetical protein